MARDPFGKIGSMVGLVTDLVPLLVIVLGGYLAYQAWQKNCFLGIGGACGPGGAPSGQPTNGPTPEGGAVSGGSYCQNNCQFLFGNPFGGAPLWRGAYDACLASCGSVPDKETQKPVVPTPVTPPAPTAPFIAVPANVNFQPPPYGTGIVGTTKVYTAPTIEQAANISRQLQFISDTKASGGSPTRAIVAAMTTAANRPGGGGTYTTKTGTTYYGTAAAAQRAKGS